MFNHKSQDTRKVAIDYYYENEVSQSQIAQIFKITDRTFRNWLKQYNENNSIERLQRNTKSYKTETCEIFKKIIKSNPTWSINMLWNKLNSKFNDFEYQKVI